MAQPRPILLPSYRSMSVPNPHGFSRSSKQVRKSFLTLDPARGSLGAVEGTMSELELTRWQRLRLQRQLKQTQDARVYRRTLALLDYSRGEPISHIAGRLGVTRQSVYNWIAAYAEASDPWSLVDDQRPGRPSLWTDEMRAMLQALLEQRPDQLGYFAVNWTVPLFQDALAAYTGRRPSADTIRRELDRLGYVWKRSRDVLDPDPDGEKKTPDPRESPGFAAAQRRVG
jgi:transposase